LILASAEKTLGNFVNFNKLILASASPTLDYSIKFLNLVNLVSNQIRVGF